MRIAVSVVRPFHTVLMANALRQHVEALDIWTSAPRKFYKGLSDRVPTHLIPSPVDIAARVLRKGLSANTSQRGIQLWDRMVASVIPSADLTIGFATQSLSTGRATHKRGHYFALDRACPHVDFQQDIIRQESEATGAVYTPEPTWFRERQLQEYEIADTIVVPSNYSGRTFPAHLQSKLLLAPLMGRARAHGEPRLQRNSTFTVGVLGGNPLRKGYRFLLEAWKRLDLPNARLQIRSSSDFSPYPKLAELLRTTPNVEIIDYIPNIAEFYQRCDLFVLPSMDDGFGMALFEAMANGVPAIATRNCGASELMLNGQDGIVIDAGNTDQLASSILSLYENEELRQGLARAGQAAIQRISAASVYEEALLQLLARVHAKDSAGQNAATRRSTA